jgi:predicted flavoprotein YhiN
MPLLRPRPSLLLLVLHLIIINTMAAALAKRTMTVAVVGGGAAGYMSAIIAASTLKAKGIKATVKVMELSKSPLQKVSISGGGRCNVMHDPTKGARQISQGYPRGEKELLGPYSKTFGPKETYDWFSSRTPLKTEADGRVFPTSDKSQSIIRG